MRTEFEDKKDGIWFEKVALSLKFEFANEANKEILRKKVLDWLKNDFEQKGKPQGHFWYHRDQIGYSLSLMPSTCTEKAEEEMVSLYFAEMDGSDSKTGMEKGHIYIDKATHQFKFLNNGVISEGKLPDKIDLSQLGSNPEDPFLKKQVLDYLSQAEYISQSNGFNSCDGMLVLSEQDELVAYMIWSPEFEYVFSIDIVEVVEKYQNQGIFKIMISELSFKFPDVCVLKGNLVQASVEKFKHLGWESENKEGYFFKKIRESVPALEALPEGHVIAVTSAHYYTIYKDPSDYPMKYFKIKIDSYGILEIPIIMSHDPKGYIEIYLNRHLIAAQKIDYLLRNPISPGGDLLVIGRIELRRPELFTDFFRENEIKSEERAVVDFLAKNLEEPAPKKRRTNYTPATFSLSRQTGAERENSRLLSVLKK